MNILFDDELKVLEFAYLLLFDAHAFARLLLLVAQTHYHVLIVFVSVCIFKCHLDVLFFHFKKCHVCL